LFTIQPEIGFVNRVESGRLIRKNAFARPSSFLGNQFAITVRRDG
jgi:hypothetical protein